jgi:CHAT domain-containing protein
LRDTLIGGWQVIDDVEAPCHLALMEAIADEVGDKRLRAFALLFHGTHEAHRENFGPALHVLRDADSNIAVQLMRTGDPDKAIALGLQTASPFDRLPGSGQEVRDLARALGADDAWVWTGERATEARIKAASRRGALRQARRVHLATHGVLDAGSGRGPALVLCQVGTSGAPDPGGGVDDGLLTLAEVANLRLNADLVVLSGCQTGRGRLYDGEGFVSLARAFLSAGSQGVVCSLWQVDDEATAGLMQRLYGGLQAQPGAETGKALREARLALIRDGEPPFVWAPFIHLGH